MARAPKPSTGAAGSPISTPSRASRVGQSTGLGGSKAVPHGDTPNNNPYRSTALASGGQPIPLMADDMTWHPVGSTGLRQFSGWVREEFLLQLQGRQAARVYREMLDNSPIVGAIIFAITQSMRKVEWRVQEADDTPAAQEGREFVESIMDDMADPWEHFVDEALSMLVYGFSAHEIVYKKRMGHQDTMKTGLASSRYDDGMIGLEELGGRGQDPILKWFFDANGKTLGLTQQPYVGPLVDIPVEKLLLFHPSKRKKNPEGYSVLRNSYVSYYYIKRLQEYEAILLERMSGFPVIYLPNAVLEAAAAGEPGPLAAYNAYKNIIQNIKIDEQMGLLLPSDTYPGPNGPSNVRMYEFTFVTPTTTAGIEKAYDTVIERNKLDILYTVLADFIQMGHSSRGAQSLAISKVDMFFQAIEGYLNSIAAVLNRHLLPRLWRLNGFPEETMPEFVPDMAQRVDLDSLGNFILHLAQAGMPLFPDDDLENWVRDAGGLPDKSEEAYYGTEEISPDGDEEASNGEHPAGAAASNAIGAQVAEQVQDNPADRDGPGNQSAAQKARVLKLLGISTPRQKRRLARAIKRIRGDAGDPWTVLP